MTMVVESNELQAVDIAVGVLVAQCYSDLDGTTGPKAWQDFVSRPINKKIFRHDPFDIPGFLKALKSSGKLKATGPNGELETEKIMPVIGYSRKPGLTNENDPFHIKTPWLTDPNVGVPYRATLTKAQLEYTVRWMAWDRNSLDKMISTWANFIVRVPNGIFQSWYLIQGATEQMINCQIINRRNFSITDASVNTESQRIYAAEYSFGVETLLISDVKTTPFPDPIRIEFVGGIIGQKGGFLDIGLSQPPTLSFYGRVYHHGTTGSMPAELDDATIYRFEDHGDGTFVVYQSGNPTPIDFSPVALDGITTIRNTVIINGQTYVNTVDITSINQGVTPNPDTVTLSADVSSWLFSE